MAEQLVAILHQAVKQFRQTHGGAGAAGQPQRLTQGRVQPGGARQVVARAAQDQVAHAQKGSVAAFSQDRNEQADEFPPVPQRRPGQVLQAFRQMRIGIGTAGVLDHGGRAEQLEAGLPQVEGRQVSFQGGLGVVRPAMELRQRQWKTLWRLFLGAEFTGHGLPPSALGLIGSLMAVYDPGRKEIKQDGFPGIYTGGGEIATNRVGSSVKVLGKVGQHPAVLDAWQRIPLSWNRRAVRHWSRCENAPIPAARAFGAANARVTRHPPGSTRWRAWWSGPNRQGA